VIDMKLPGSQYPITLHFVAREPSRLRKMLSELDEHGRYRTFFYQDPSQLLGKMNLPRWHGRGMQLYFIQWESLHEVHPNTAAGFIRRLARWINPEHIGLYAKDKHAAKAQKLAQHMNVPYIPANVNFQHRLENFVKSRQSRFVFTRLKRRMMLLSVIFLLLMGAVIFVFLQP